MSLRHLRPFERVIYSVMVAGAAVWAWAIVEACGHHWWPLTALVAASIAAVGLLSLRA